MGRNPGLWRAAQAYPRKQRRPGKRPWGPGNFGHIRLITAIDGNTIALDFMLPQSIQKEHGGGNVSKVSAPSLQQYCGVESLRIVSNYDKTQGSSSKDANYINLRNAIGMKCMNSWVRNCTTMNVWYAAVQMGGSQFCTVRDVKSLAMIGPVRGGKRYTFSINESFGMLVYNCVAEEGRHDFVIGARTEGPNVFLKCSVSKGGNGEPHHRWSVGTLWDNVSMPTGALCTFNRGDSGSGHGWAGANNVFWNCNAKSIVVFDPETEGENNFAIGYTGKVVEQYGTGTLYYANTRAGYWQTPQEGKYYGYASMGSGHIVVMRT